ncbi:hypothetical protein EDB81DRAFT_181508 [Dactylonectria macrodidyma]|uniref:Uncharacterized protein n=1 Tax=Dactylonectria macrodidyma TaxID=307937 RepID=A0A9P9FSA2_9HYPO|nr:hypothetical protein EDB81DRAFT_181508 [Dactylonectria macrodidyma]
MEHAVGYPSCRVFNRNEHPGRIPISRYRSPFLLPPSLLPPSGPSLVCLLGFTCPSLLRFQFAFRLAIFHDQTLSWGSLSRTHALLDFPPQPRGRFSYRRHSLSHRSLGSKPTGQPDAKNAQDEKPRQRRLRDKTHTAGDLCPSARCFCPLVGIAPCPLAGTWTDVLSKTCSNTHSGLPTSRNCTTTHDIGRCCCHHPV